MNEERMLQKLTAVIGAALAASNAWAVKLDTGDPDWNVRLDNTAKASTIYRTTPADPALVDSFRLLVPGVPASAFPQALNLNAGDDNFRNRGFVSKRADLLTEFDAVYKKEFGLRVSGAGWYDAVYHRATDATDPVNGQSPMNEFTPEARKLAGGKAEFLDAFVFGGWALDEGRKLNVRLGQHTLQYGESLFFGDNGIARAQGPLDILKLLSSPNAQFKEILRPVPQLSAQLQVTPDLSFGGYYQFRWEADRLPPAGSYFSFANTPPGSSLSQVFSIPSGPIAGNYALRPGADLKAKNSGQFGLQARLRAGETDLGLYAARYHDKSGQPYGDLNVANPLDSRWFYKFPESVKTVGISATQSFGSVNFAGEASIRWDMPLRSQQMLYPSLFASMPRFAKGRTAHLNISWLATLGPSFISRESSFLGEVAWNRVLKTNDPDGELDASRTRNATALQFIFTPTYRQALPGLDINVPIGLRYTLDGQSAITYWDARGSGTATVGIEGNYLGLWQFTATYSRFIGRAAPFVDYSPALTGGNPTYSTGNPLADRDNIAFSLRRTF